MDKKLVEVTRSFSYKLNVGNYESRDFFCSQKAECYEDEVEAVSQKLHDFCKQEVIKSVNEFQNKKEDLKLKEIEKAYKDQPEIKGKMSQEELEKEWMMQNNIDAKRGD